MDERISVIVPVYNAEQFLTRCVKSILNQSYSNIELILVNDGSTDGSLPLCQKFASKDSRVKLITKRNGGAASARNVGIKAATGQYIGFCDADDYIESEMLETLHKLMKEQDLYTIECTSQVEDVEGNVLCCDANDRRLQLISSEEAIRLILLRKGNVHLACRLTKAELIKKIHIPEGKRVEDFYFTILLLLELENNATYTASFYHYCMSDGSVTRNPTGGLYLDALYFFGLAVIALKKHGLSYRQEQDYYKYKMYYLFAISMTEKESQVYRENIKIYKKDIRTNLSEIMKQKYLTTKEKLVLFVAGFSMRLCRRMYLLKRGNNNG